MTAMIARALSVSSFARSAQTRCIVHNAVCVCAHRTCHISEATILKNAFAKFDRDESGNVDFKEFCLALEHLGLHIQGLGAPGLGGIRREIAVEVFSRMDSDG